MKLQNTRKMNTEKMVLGAVLTALVIILQMMGQFIKLGPFSISLVLIPIVIGAALCGPMISSWLGFIFSVVVLFTDAAAFFAISVFGTIFTVILKGVACGLVSGLIYSLLEKRNKYVAIYAAAVICPIVNTGIFLLGCTIFFFEAIKLWGISYGYSNVAQYMFIGLTGGNFLFELFTNIILSPVIVRILKIKKISFKKSNFN